MKTINKRMRYSQPVHKTINMIAKSRCTLLRQFPDNNLVWDGWRFVFNAKWKDYDYLVAFGNSNEPIRVRCPLENTIHIATEPPSVHCYDEKLLSQFAWVITQNVNTAHSRRIFHQSGLLWRIGSHPETAGSSQVMSYRELEALFDQPKTKIISVISSNKAFTPEHANRLEFAQKLKAHYGDKIDFYGRGFTLMDDKLEGLKDYRFHVALENSSYDHYFSEKFTDCVLAGTYPIYYGCPNLDQYFPKNSYARIDIHDFNGAINIIDHVIKHEFDKKYREELRLARNLTLEKHNIFPMLIEIIEKIEAGKYGRAIRPKEYGNKILPFNCPKSRILKKHLNQLANKYILFSVLKKIYRGLFPV